MSKSESMKAELRCILDAYDLGHDANAGKIPGRVCGMASQLRSILRMPAIPVPHDVRACIAFHVRRRAPPGHLIVAGHQEESAGCQHHDRHDQKRRQYALLMRRA